MIQVLRIVKQFLHQPFRRPREGVSLLSRAMALGFVLGLAVGCSKSNPTPADRQSLQNFKKEGAVAKETAKTPPALPGNPAAVSNFNLQLPKNNTILPPSTAFNLTGIPDFTSREAANTPLAFRAEAIVNQNNLDVEKSLSGSVANLTPSGNSEFSVSSYNSSPAPQAYFSNPSSSGGNATGNFTALPLSSGNINSAKPAGGTPSFPLSLAPTLSSGIGLPTGFSSSNSNTSSGAGSGTSGSGGGSGTPTPLPNILPPQGLPTPFPINPPFPIPGFGIGSGVTASGDSKSSGGSNTGSTTGSSTTTGGTTTTGGSSTGGTSGGGGGTGSPPPANTPSPAGGSGAGTSTNPNIGFAGLAILAANQPPEQLDTTTDPKPNPPTPPPTGTSCSNPPCQPTEMHQGLGQPDQAPIRVEVASPAGWFTSSKQIVKDSQCLPVRKDNSGSLIKGNPQKLIFPNEPRPEVFVEYRLSKDDNWATLQSVFTNSCGQADIINLLKGDYQVGGQYLPDGCRGHMRITVTYTGVDDSIHLTKVLTATFGEVPPNSTVSSGVTLMNHYRAQKVIGCENVGMTEGVDSFPTDLIPIVPLPLQVDDRKLELLKPLVGILPVNP